MLSQIQVRRLLIHMNIRLKKAEEAWKTHTAMVARHNRFGPPQPVIDPGSPLDHVLAYLDSEVHIYNTELTAVVPWSYVPSLNGRPANYTLAELLKRH